MTKTQRFHGVWELRNSCRRIGIGIVDTKCLHQISVSYPRACTTRRRDCERTFLGGIDITFAFLTKVCIWRDYRCILYSDHPTSSFKGELSNTWLYRNFSYLEILRSHQIPPLLAWSVWNNWTILSNVCLCANIAWGVSSSMGDPADLAITSYLLPHQELVETTVCCG